MEACNKAALDEEARAAEASKAALLSAKRVRMLDEPTNTKGCGVVDLQIRLPGQTALRRRFPAGSTVRNVRDFVDVTLHDQEPERETVGYALEMLCPRRVLDDEDAVLEACGLSEGQWMLMLNFEEEGESEEDC